MDVKKTSYMMVVALCNIQAALTSGQGEKVYQKSRTRPQLSIY